MSHQVISCEKSSLGSVPTTSGIYIFKDNAKPIYIGKSVNIRARLKSHFENAKVDLKEKAIIDSSKTISYIVTDSEFKALLLESKYIQKYKPRYNVRWRDDKSYLYIKVTIKDIYPKIFITRKENDKKSLYFGPFSSVRIIRSILKEIRRVFPFCTQKQLTKQKCFYAKIHLCNPCPSEIEKLKNEKEKIQAQKTYLQNIKNVVKVLDGKTELILKKLYLSIKEFNKTEEFEKSIPLRERILRLEGMLSNKRFDENMIDQYNQSTKQILALQVLLGKYMIVDSLCRIECFDMSTMTFENSSASMVVFTDGLSDKKEYKRFKIKQEANSDFEMFDEVLKRRFKNNWPMPDLLIVDGGKPQVRVAQRVFESLGITVPLIGIAKRPDRLIIGDDTLQTIKPYRHHLGFRLVQALRDESHRFAKKYHLFLRGKTDGIKTDGIMKSV
ncbi:hypothetical protein COU87_01230 [Candidatus Roizmanbacteria bacterium CG10_big_fil_rev_8_21_14_0_10_39_12]|uniref:Excinuclease ABC subunit C n=1 Tax=Candidatus Roizmanbacteria bacterium CG10_big_fil_rev_8_21_14_0_10_39_12 TaxID=1974852 RepID=A0A2M8KQ83_9BACT|nr:MAG: hypothetical protein COU87_01230 [Candidatus Roizmanbacteria bacterium CG10_big_fil_rev_8_21_14_0_10_39_12]